MADEPWEGEPVELVDSTSPSTLNFSSRARTYILNIRLISVVSECGNVVALFFAVLFRRENMYRFSVVVVFCASRWQPWLSSIFSALRAAL